MIMLIIIAAVFLNFVLSIIGLTQAWTDFVTGLGWTPMQTMLLTMAPLITPIVVALGFDSVWFGILLMVLLETALITPPIGINLYVVQGIRERGRMSDVMLGAAPFVIALFMMVLLLILFPSLALWLPDFVGY
jgi:TRAP-type C4-dicarboxylate transport system permease large subunit